MTARTSGVHVRGTHHLWADLVAWWRGEDIVPSIAPHVPAGWARHLSLEDQGYRRLRGDAVWRPTGVRWVEGTPVLPRGVPGWVCAFADDALDVGDHLEVELFVGGGAAVLIVEVVAVVPLPPTDPARFDLALRVLGAEGVPRGGLADAIGG